MAQGQKIGASGQHSKPSKNAKKSLNGAIFREAYKSYLKSKIVEATNMAHRSC